MQTDMFNVLYCRNVSAQKILTMMWLQYCVCQGRNFTS